MVEYKNKLTNEFVSSGVVAQQVKEIVPDAVRPIIEYVYDIMKYCDIKTVNEETFLEFDGVHEIKVGDMIKIDRIIKIEEGKNNGFVIGRKVNNFLAVDKGMLGIIALGAIKELHEIINKKKNRVRMLENGIERLKSLLQN